MIDSMQKRRIDLCAAVCVAVLLLISCNHKQSPAETATPSASQQTPQPRTTGVPDSDGHAQEKSQPKAVVLPGMARHTDDLDGMLKRRTIRALVMINPIGFFFNNGHPMGVNYEALRAFETFINQKSKQSAIKVQVTFIPVRPDEVQAALTDGVGDLIAYALVITPERQQQVAFTVPIETGVNQVIVTGPDFGAVSSLEGLGGKEIFVNPLAVNYSNLQRVNERLKKEGKTPIVIKAADVNLLDDDLLQMVNAGLLPATATTASRAKLWSQVLPHLTPHLDLVITSGEQTAWAVRKDNPQLKQVLDEFVSSHAAGTSFGNTLLRRYLQNTKWVKDATSPQEMRKFQTLVAYFKKYAGQYDFDYLMIAAQGYQESLLDQSKRNRSGAMGIMQVIPRYAAASPINVPNVTTAEDNIRAGVKMLRNIEDQYFSDPKIDQVDKTLFVFASYNAGPNRIARLRKEAQRQGLDPDKWFNNVELVAAEDIGQETVTYVGNVYKYYVAYKLALEQAQSKSLAQQTKAP